MDKFVIRTPRQKPCLTNVSSPPIQPANLITNDPKSKEKKGLTHLKSPTNQSKQKEASSLKKLPQVNLSQFEFKDASNQKNKQSNSQQQYKISIIQSQDDILSQEAISVIKKDQKPKEKSDYLYVEPCQESDSGTEVLDDLSHIEEDFSDEVILKRSNNKKKQFEIDEELEVERKQIKQIANLRVSEVENKQEGIKGSKRKLVNNSQQKQKYYPEEEGEEEEDENFIYNVQDDSDHINIEDFSYQKKDTRSKLSPVNPRPPPPPPQKANNQTIKEKPAPAPSKNDKRKNSPVQKEKVVQVQGGTELLAGLTIVFTGQFQGISRDTLSEIVIKNGAKNTKSVSKKTSIVVYGYELEDGRPSNEGRKYKEAQQKGVQLKSQDQFSEFLKDILGKSLEELAQVDSNTKWYDKFSSNSKVKQKDEEEESNNVTAAPPPKNKKVLIPMNLPKAPIIAPPKKVVPPPPAKMWTQKYTPSQFNEYIGNQANLEKIMVWLQDWVSVVIKGNKKVLKNTYFNRNMAMSGDNSNNLNAKACLLSGPPGVGKTTAVRLISKQMGYEVREWNASDDRSKKDINTLLGELKTNSIIHLLNKNKPNAPNNSDTLVKATLNQKFVILMDEVDGMSSGDRGGNAALIDAIKTTNVPIICICNDRMNPKVRSLANYCYDIKFQKPAKQDIVKHMAKICNKEGINSLDNAAIEEITQRLGCDLRQTLNYLELHFKTSNSLQLKDLGKLYQGQKDTTGMMEGFEASLQLMQSFKFQKLSLRERVELFFIDYDLIPLLVQQNYLDTIPSVENKMVTISQLQSLASATASIAESDIVNQQIRSKGNWQLLPNLAFLSSIYPCDKVCGEKPVYPRFPEWLGKNSSQRKIMRELREMRIILSESISSGSRFAVKFDYIPILLQIIIRTLKKGTDEAIEQVLGLLESYNLKPEHIKEHLNDLQYPKQDYYSSVDSNTKSKLTRQFNQRFTDDSKKIKSNKGKTASENQPRYDKNLDDVIYSSENENEQMKDEEAENEDVNPADQSQNEGKIDSSKMIIKKQNGKKPTKEGNKKAPTQKNTSKGPKKMKKNQIEEEEDSMDGFIESDIE